VIERVRELARRGRRAVAEPRVVGRNEVEVPSQERDEVAKHVRRRRKAMQKEQRGGVRRARLAVENVQPVHLDRAMVHRRIRAAINGHDETSIRCSSKRCARAGGGRLRRSVTRAREGRAER
jgi:hypothetical protein